MVGGSLVLFQPGAETGHREGSELAQGHTALGCPALPLGFLLVSLPGGFPSHAWKSLVGYSPWGRTELDTTERLHFHFSLSCTGEGNGNPLQCSCLENPRDGGAWWAAIYGVAKSQTRLKQLSSSSSRSQLDVGSTSWSEPSMWDTNPPSLPLQVCCGRHPTWNWPFLNPFQALCPTSSDSS